MFFERRCAGCGSVGWVICGSCVAALQPAPLDARPSALDGPLDTFAAAMTYDPLAARLILAAKNGGRRDVLRALAAPMTAALGPGEIDVVTWVPASRTRRRRRGYDQAEVLARSVARRLGRPARRLLNRADSDAQANLGRERRLAGPSIRVAGRRPSGSVLLVDDVTTTGASLAACAQALRVAGAPLVSAVVAAVVDTAVVTPSLSTMSAGRR